MKLLLCYRSLFSFWAAPTFLTEATHVENELASMEANLILSLYKENFVITRYAFFAAFDQSRLFVKPLIGFSPDTEMNLGKLIMSFSPLLYGYAET